MTEHKRYVVAVSGGVDSVVLLHMLANSLERELIVAHFDHGIRDDSASDAEFVGELAKRYGLPYETRREELGTSASEELARNRRYTFLREVAGRHSALVATAHHGDDIVETVAINMTRGTGWRGLAVLDSDVVRPLLHMTKSEIVAYANEHGLAWHEDSTNTSNVYLRNRLRRNMSHLSHDDAWQVRALRARQTEIKKEIDSEVHALVGDGPDYSRYFFTHTDHSTALECLRFVTRGQLTRPQRTRALLAIKTAKAGTRFEAGAGVSFVFTSRHFSIELVK